MPLNPIKQRLGKTAYDGYATPDASNLKYVSDEGMQWNNIPNVDASQVLTGQETRNKRNGKMRRAVLVRNTQGSALTPGTVCTWESGYHGRRVVQAGAGSEFAGVIDELLPAAGVPDDDVCWLIVEGETLVNKASADAFSLGDFLNTGASGEVSGDLKEVMIALTSGKVHDALATDLGASATSDDMGIVTGTPGTDGPTLQGVDFGGTTSDEKAGFEFVIPHDYVAGETFTVRVRGSMVTTVSDDTATVDCEAWLADEDGAVGSDICATAAQSINSLTKADKDFTITPTTLTPGAKLMLRFAFAGSDSTNDGVMIPEISKISVLYSGGQFQPDRVGRVVEAAGASTTQVLCHVKAFF